MVIGIGRPTLGRLLAAVPGGKRARRRLREVLAVRRTANEALRLATEASRAVETLLQREIELERELAELRGADREIVR